MLRTIALTLLVVSLPTLAQNSDDLRVDPPFWWQGFEHRELQLMISGDSVGDTRVSVDYPGIRVSRIVRTDNNDYLFVYLDIDAIAAPGNVTITLEGNQGIRQTEYVIRERRPGSHERRGFDTSDVIYLVTPDRYANGDTDNDTIEGYADGLDRDAPYGRHGGDLAGIRDSLDYMRDMGFTMLWLNPVFENAMDEASYHGYAITDHYRVDPRYGSNAEYQQLVEDAGQRGIGVIMDMVENHIGIGHPWMQSLPAPDWINMEGKFRETNHARTINQGMYASAADSKLMTDGWFAPTMPDLNQRNPLLADYLIQNSIWWIEFADLAGIRQDTWPYPDKRFMAEWTRRILDEYPNFNIVGEEWSLEPAIVAYWQAGNTNHDGYESALPSLFDFPLHDALIRSLTDPGKEWGSVWTPVYETLAMDFLYPQPNNLVIFPDNHDMSRIATQLGDDHALVRMALAFVATMRGIPQVFYGTEIGMTHPGTESHGVIRSDFPGGWRGDSKNAFTGVNLTDPEASLQGYLRALLNWRKTARVVHGGGLMQLAPEGMVYAFARYDDEDLLIVAFNRGHDAEHLDSSRYGSLLDGRRRARNALTGDVIDIVNGIELPPRSVAILEVTQSRE